MRKMLNTLYVTTPDSYLAREGQNVLVMSEQQVHFRVPIHNLEGIVSFNYTGASPSLMQLCCENGVGLTFLNEYGRFLARVSGRVSGNILLRKEQYRWTDSSSHSLRLSKRFIVGKLLNQSLVLKRAMRDHPTKIDVEGFKAGVKEIDRFTTQIEAVKEDSVLLGIEGMAASIYFGLFDQMIVSNRDEFLLTGRSRRPPLDRTNAMLSYVYTLLTHDVISALETVGLDPQAGFFHKDRPGRPSLALDLMEELRPHIADRLVLTLINRNQIQPNQFLIKENSAVLMNDEARKTLIMAWQNRKRDLVFHPYLKEKVMIGLLPYVQSMLLARHIRGDIEDYPPFVWK